MDYESFLNRKLQSGGDHGFDPPDLPDFLFPFQRHLVQWALRKGRAAIFADCGLGKTAMQLVWADQVVRRTGKPVLILTPLAVSIQTASEAEKFGVEASRNQTGKVNGAKVYITNYERLHHFNPGDFEGCVCDESSILKNMNGETRKQVTQFMQAMPFRLLSTATAAPNDFYEVGTSSDALGYLGARDMLTRFFKEDVVDDYLGWGRKNYRFRGHSEQPFWRWVCSWARACRKPSDLGFRDDGFNLPPLIEKEIVVENSAARPGLLFSMPAKDLREQREERRISIGQRCEVAADIAHKHKGSTVLWCHLNQEGDELARSIKDCVQVSGSMSDEEKEDRLVAFATGKIKRLVTKPKIGCFGLNWQHCNNVVTFPSHSFEQYYQAVRRCWRFGQKNPVTVSVIATVGEQGISENLKRKAAQCDKMFSELVKHMGNELKIVRTTDHKTEERIPSWLASTK